MDGDMEANISKYCLLKFHWKPSEYLNLSTEEKAFVVAVIQQKIESDKKEIEKLKKG